VQHSDFKMIQNETARKKAIIKLRSQVIWPLNLTVMKYVRSEVKYGPGNALKADNF